MLNLALLAAEVDPSGSSLPLGSLLQYGVLGLVVVGFITGWIVPGPQAKALAAENARLSALIEGRLFPMLEQHASTMERAAIALENSAAAMNRQSERERVADARKSR
jgi:cytochrome b